MAVVGVGREVIGAVAASELVHAEGEHDVPASVGGVAVEDKLAFFGIGELTGCHLLPGVDAAKEWAGLQAGLADTGGFGRQGGFECVGQHVGYGVLGVRLRYF